MNFNKNARANVIDIDIVPEFDEIKKRNPELKGFDDLDPDDVDFDFIYTEERDYSDDLIRSVYVILTNMGFINDKHIVDHKKIKNGDIIRLKQLSGYRNDGLLVCLIDEGFHMSDPNSFSLDIYGVFRLTNRELILKNLDKSIDEYGSLPREFHVSDKHNSYYWSDIITHNSIVWLKPEWVKHFKFIKYDKITNYGLGGMFTYTTAKIYNIKYTIIYIPDMETISSNDLSVEFQFKLVEYEINKPSLTFHYYDLLSNIRGPGENKMYGDVSRDNVSEHEEVLFACNF